MCGLFPQNWEMGIKILKNTSQQVIGKSYVYGQHVYATLSAKLIYIYILLLSVPPQVSPRSVDKMAAKIQSLGQLIILW